MYPSLSPDGTSLVFSFGGDLWLVPATGGAAARITSHPADELRSAFSPDGSILAFDSQRDGYRNLYAMTLDRKPSGPVPGDIRRLTHGDRPHQLSGFSADGSRVLFDANLEPEIFRGTRMYSAPVSGRGPTTRLTDAWGGGPAMAADGSSLLFHRNRFDPTRPAYQGPATADVYRLDLGSGTFTQLTFHRAQDGDPGLLADGSVVFVSARDGQNNIWRLPPGATNDATAQQVTSFKPATGEVTLAHGVRHFSVAPGGRHAAFVVWDTLYTTDFTGPQPRTRPVPVTIGGDTAQLDSIRMNLGGRADEIALSPDGKTMAVAVRGEIFVRSTEKDRPTRRVTDSAARDRGIAWAPDGTALYFSHDESGTYALYRATVDLAREDLDPARKDKGDAGRRWSEALTFKIEPVVVSGKNDQGPLPSPDGKSLLFIRGRGDLILFDVTNRTERLLLPGWNSPDATWCPDSRHIVFSRLDEYFNPDLWLLDTSAPDAKPVNITRHPDADTSPRITADGKILYFLSDRDADTNGEMSLYAVNLDRRLDGLADYELAEHFKTAAENAKKRKPPGTDAKEKKPEAKTDAKPGDKPEAQPADKPDPATETKPAAKPDAATASTEPAKETKAPEPLRFHLDDAHLRVRPVGSVRGIRQMDITPGGERIVFSASVDGVSGLFSVDYAGKERKTVATGARSPAVNLTGDKVAYLAGGDPAIGKPMGGESERLPIDAPVVIDVEQQQRQKFLEAARLLGEGFYHPTLKGLDWDALTRRYLQLALKTRTDAEFNQVVGNLFGELDGSHLGIRGGPSESRGGMPLGHLGVVAAPDPSGWKVTQVLARGPADRETSKLDVGEVIVAINNVPTAADGGPKADLPVLLAGTARRETLLKIAGTNAAERLVLITPVDSETDGRLRYTAEVARRQALVDKLSGGRLGYLHIRGMDIDSVREFERDLYAAAFGRQALIIDVRDNGGGWTTDILLASLTAPRHAYTVARGADPATMPRDAYPRDRRLIYAYNRPISVLINQNSYSNAEIFPHAIKTTGRGKLVGVETFGAVISTGSAVLIDGTVVRMPFRGWHLRDGTDMEKNGAKPDIAVPMTPEAEVQGRDPQIEAAVTELLERSNREPFWDWKP